MSRIKLRVIQLFDWHPLTDGRRMLAGARAYRLVNLPRLVAFSWHICVDGNLIDFKGPFVFRRRGTQMLWGGGELTVMKTVFDSTSQSPVLAFHSLCLVHPHFEAYPLSPWYFFIIGELNCASWSIVSFCYFILLTE